jgi:metal-sulfur cluster biosynthetic enzyme
LIDKKIVMKELEKVLDPEIGIPITSMKLIDKILITGDEVLVEFHLTMPWCPGVFAMQIAKDIKKVVSEIDGVKKVEVKLKNHYMDEQINKEVNR